MSTTATLIAGRATQRKYLRVEVGTPRARANLTGKTLQCILSGPAEETPQTVTAALSPQTGATLGQFYIDVTDVNLLALAAHKQLLLSTHVWNSDGSLFINRAATLNVTL